MTTKVVVFWLGQTAKPSKGETVMDKQTGKFIARIAENLPDMPSDLMQDWIDDPKRIQKFLKGLCPQEVAFAPKEEAPLDTIIHIDRSIRPVYPDWVKTVMHPEFEDTGPIEYDLATEVELWLHGGQKGDVVKGEVIYSHLKDTNALGWCLNLQDGFAIQQKGITVFYKLFGGKRIFLWKSVVRNRNRCLNAPYLCASGGKVMVNWRWLGYDWNGFYPAIRFANN